MARARSSLICMLALHCRLRSKWKYFCRGQWSIIKPIIVMMFIKLSYLQVKLPQWKFRSGEAQRKLSPLTQNLRSLIIFCMAHWITSGTYKWFAPIASYTTLVNFRRENVKWCRMIEGYQFFRKIVRTAIRINAFCSLSRLEPNICIVGFGQTVHCS